MLPRYMSFINGYLLTGAAQSVFLLRSLLSPVLEKNAMLGRKRSEERGTCSHSPPLMKPFQRSGTPGSHAGSGLPVQHLHVFPLVYIQGDKRFTPPISGQLAQLETAECECYSLIPEREVNVKRTRSVGL